MTEILQILIIDDDEVDRMTLTRAMKGAGIKAEVKEVMSCSEGYTILKEQSFDCIFLDYMLPDNDGLTVLRALRQQEVESPIIMLTGQGNAELAVEMMKAGASDYIAKNSLTPEILSRNLQQVIRIHRMECERKQVEEEREALLVKLQNTQDQLLQSDKMASIGLLAAGVAHEINNPVGYINSNISTLKQYVSDIFDLLNTYETTETLITDNKARNSLQALKEKIDLEYLKEDIQCLVKESQEGLTRVKQIVQDLKDFSHVDEAEWQWVDLHEGIDSTLNIVRNEIKYKAEFVKEYEQLPKVECFPSQLNQVFMNLLVNASHAIEENGTITIRTGLENNEVWIEIADTGKGIQKEQLNKIFDPFFTTKPIGEGTGLGLSLSYSIVQKHGGRIDVNSDVGKGTSFKIWLPVQQKEAKAID